MKEQKKWFGFHSNQVRRKYDANTTETPHEEEEEIVKNMA